MPQDQDDIKGADAMKQAPAPGPLSQIPTAVVADTMNVMARAYERIHSMPRVSDTELAIKVGEAKERLRPFLAPTAPVEASGSEREEEEAYKIGKRDGYEAAVQDIDYLTGGDGEYRVSTDDPGRHVPDAYSMKAKIAERFSALRPQPSGETREAAIKELIGGYAVMHEAICFMAGTSGAVGRWYYEKANDAFSKVKPLHLFADALNPAPVALGGQHSGGEVDKVEMIADLIEKYTYVMSKHNPDMARVAGHNSCAQHILAALSTPPVPAQDDDKLRRAVEALEPFAEMATAGDQRPKDDAVWAGQDGRRITFGDFRRAAEAHAALKSTAAQEGGES